MADTDVSRADFLQHRLRAVLDTTPCDPVAVEQARVELAAAREVVAMELQKAAMVRERKALHNVELERELLELKKSQLTVSTVPAASSMPLRPTLRSRSRSTGVRTPPPAALPLPVPAPLPSSWSGAEQLAGLDEDDHTTASAATTQASESDVRQLASMLLGSLRADLLKQQIKPLVAATANTGSATATEPAVEVEVACRAMSTVLTSLESRLALFHALEQRLTAVRHMEHVELNVGGERFHTTVATLCKEPSYLQGMFSGYLF